VILRACIALLFVCPFGTAQVATARLEGVVRDGSGAVVVSASVAVVNNRTRIRVETAADAEGRFAFPSLPPSIYTLTVEAAGFRKTVVSDLELNVGATVTQSVNLEIGAVTDSLVVQAPEERVQVADAQVSRAIKLRDIDVLPQMARYPILLAAYNPGTQAGGGGLLSARVNGTRQGSTNSKLDGIDVTQGIAPSFGLSVIPNNPDSIEELRIVTSGGKAEYGHSAGGQIEMITRSGTDNWQGNIFEYHRNTALNANTFFGNSSGLPRAVFIQNVFGGSLGGPIRRDSTFIFGNYQGRRTAEQAVVNRTVLTPDARAGRFRWRAPGTSEIQVFDIVRNDPRGKGIDPQVAGILKLLPDPNNPDIGDTLNTAGFRFNNASGSGLDRNDAFTIKADHNLWSGHRVFFRWAQDGIWFIDAGATFPGQPKGMQGGPVWSYSIGSDWAITSRLVNELRVGYKFFEVHFRRPARLHGPMLLSNSWFDPLATAFESVQSLPVRHITDSLTMVHGKHTFKAGLEWRFSRQRASSDSGIWSNVSFAISDGNAVPAGIGPAGNTISPADRQTFDKLYNDLLGRMSLVTQAFYSDLEEFQAAGTPRVRDYRFHEQNYFFQDDWKLHPRFVLNLGLRYEFSGAPFEVNRFQGTVDQAALISHAARVGDLTMQRGNRWYRDDFNNFAPRIGLAWDLTGDARTALRANWGVYYDRLIGATTNYVDAFTPGFSQTVPVYPNSPGSDVRVGDGIPSPPQPSVPVLRLPATRSTPLALFSPNLRTGYVQHYSLTLQREILRNTVVEAGYVGTHGTKLFMDLDLNQPRIYEDFLGAFRELQAFRTRGTPVPASNTLIRIFGTEALAITGIGGAGVLDQGAVGTAADSVDRLSFGRYAAAGVSDFYLRNFPQFSNVIFGTNDGRSYFDSFQLSLRRQAGALKFAANYTFSKSTDNISVDGNGFTSPADSFNVRLNRARGDVDIPHAFNLSFIYTLPIGKGRRLAASAPRWVDSAIGGWDLGLLTIWQSGRTLTFLSGRATGPRAASSFANYTGDRNIGRVTRKTDGVYWLTAEEIGRFSFPSAGEIGRGGRNAFRCPRFFNLDMSLVKRFKLTERRAVSFRSEAYNLFNNPNFGAPNASLSTPASFGKISATVGNARILQMALRYEF
jgi:hypothetical protein